MSYGRRLLLPSLLGAMTVFATACRTPSSSSESSVSANQQKWDFCQQQGLATDPNSSELWSAETVQAELQKLLNEPFMGRSPWSAYLISYQKMTAARDKARCTGTLRSSDSLMQNMNHLLSDIMTRWYVTLMRECQVRSIEVPGFCPLVKTIKTKNYDALSAAMAATGIYLSSHLALSLSAIAYADDFWDATPLPETHRGSGSWQEVRTARLRYLKKFKPTYDAFNGFLGNEIKTVATTLKDADLIKGNTLNLAAGLSNFVPHRAAFFGRIRDEAFEAGQKIVEAVEPKAHPLIAVTGSRHALAYGSYGQEATVKPFLAPVESYALKAVAGPFALLIYKNLMGGKTWEEVMKETKGKGDDFSQDSVP